MNPPLSHDMPCPVCRHAWHVLVCSETCECIHPPVPGLPDP